ncbi:hypothetical protein HDV57DRAFT_266709 [Trichoderma longibrachiatum]
MSPNPLFARAESDCLPGTTFYSCVTNKFRGCCSTDPCALSSCPDGVIWKVTTDLNGDHMPSKTASEPDKATPTPTDEDDRGGHREESTSSRPTPTSKKSATITDSGITHTIPNNSIVTVTRHTTIITGRPTTTTSDSDTFASSPSTSDVPPLTGSIPATSDITPAPSSSPNAATTTSPSEASSTASPLSTGVIVGAAIGGAVVLAILFVVAFALLRRRKKQQSGSETASVIQQDTGRDEVVEDKHFPLPVSAHTTGTQASSDPFAPFGGRADQPEDPYRPPSGTFEMDGTSAPPVELPAVSASSPGPSTQKGKRPEPVQEVTPADPRANLTSGPADDGKPVYVNHWNQYKNLG